MHKATTFQRVCDAFIRQKGLCVSIVDRVGNLVASAGDASLLDTKAAAAAAAAELESKDERCLAGEGMTIVAAGFVTHMRILGDDQHMLIAMFDGSKVADTVRAVNAAIAEGGSEGS